MPEIGHELEHNGPDWWFNQDLTQLSTCLTQLEQLSPKKPLTPRLRLLKCCLDPMAHPEFFEAAFEIHCQAQQWDDAAVAAGAAVSGIWYAGEDFRRFKPWRGRIRSLEADGEKLSPLARASIAYAHGLAVVLGTGDLKRTLTILEEGLEWAEMARSPSLRIIYATTLAMTHMKMGNVADIDILFADIKPLVDQPQTTPVARMQFKMLAWLNHFFSGKLEEAKAVLEEAVSEPGFDTAPPGIFFYSYIHLFLTVCVTGEQSKIERLAAEMRRRSVPHYNHMCHAILHYGLATAALVGRQPGRALIHAREAQKWSAKCGYDLMYAAGAVQVGQALADLSQIEDAITHIEATLTKLDQRGFNYHAASAAFELARIFLDKGDRTTARQYLSRALGWRPHQNPAYSYFRPPRFVENLMQQLSTEAVSPPITQWATGETAAVKIRTMGALQIRIGDCLIEGHRWRARRTRQLLEAIISMGAYGVPIHYLCDSLWPDTEGDKALGNFKVTLSRLRRLGTTNGTPLINWIRVHNHRVSLISSKCYVDTIHFERAIDARIEKSADISQLIDAMDFYHGEFLPGGASDLWVLNYRRLLSEKLASAALVTADISRQQQKEELALPYLQKALAHNRLNEDLYAALMRCHLRRGVPSMAMQVYREAATVLTRELEVQPGKELNRLAAQAKNIR